MTFHQKKFKPGIQVQKNLFAAHHISNRNLHTRKLGIEALETRRLLSVDAPQLQLFEASPALFVENQGQWADPSIRFLHQGNGANVAMTDAGPAFQLFRTSPAAETPLENLPPETLQFSATFLNARRVVPTGLDASPTQVNYFVGDRSQWRSAVPSYATVAYENLYPGITLETRGQRDSLKYEFHVAPNADYRQILVHYSGIGGLSLAEDGSLRIGLDQDWGELIDQTPYIYQLIDGRQTEVAGHFELIDSQTYSFSISGNYDANRELVIDPDLAWSTYLGGSGGDAGNSISLDAAGNAYVAGNTVSPNFTGANNSYSGGNYDAFTAKISADGTLLWATYLGGSADDYGCGVAVDASGNAFVTGFTNSPGFAAVNNAYNGGAWDAYAAKISAEGALQWATFLGGGKADNSYAISIDAAGNALVAGKTYSSNFAGLTTGFKGGTIDAFAAKITTVGALAWATYLGGSGNDVASGISADTAGNVFVTGNTASTNFTGANNAAKGGDFDAFALKLLPAGTLAWATYLGGTGNEYGCGITQDAAGNTFVTGNTSSTNFAAANNAYKGGSFDAFAAKISPAGVIDWATYLGGNGTDVGNAVALNTAGDVFLAGQTASTNFSAANNLFKGGSYDAFAAKISSAGTLLWAIYLGGKFDDIGKSISLDASGAAYVAGQTTSTDFLSANNSSKGASDAFVAKIFDRSQTPGTVDLVDLSDNGTSNTDNLTSLDNSDADNTLQFSVGNTAIGATVTLYADGVAIGSAIATSPTTIVTTNGTFDLADGTHAITARQIEPGQPESMLSTALTITIDTITVTIDQAPAQADPTETPLIHFTVHFSEAVTDFATGDVTVSGTAGATTATVAGSGTTYDVAVSGMTANGTVIVSLLSGVAHDAVGSPSAASTSTDNVVLYDTERFLWTGGGADNNWSTADNWVGGQSPSTGNHLVFPAGATETEILADFPPETRFGSIVITGGNYRFLNDLTAASTVKVQGDAVLSVGSLVCDSLTIGAVSVPTRTWDGGGADNRWTTAANWSSDIAPSPGDNLVFPAGAAKTDNLNDFPPGTPFGSITVSGGSYHIHSNAIVSSSVIVQSSATLSAVSIICDSLVIGSPIATAQGTPHTPSRIPHTPEVTAVISPTSDVFSPEVTAVSNRIIEEFSPEGTAVISRTSEVFSPKGTAVSSQGREPLGKGNDGTFEPQRGDSSEDFQVATNPSGLSLPTKTLFMASRPRAIPSTPNYKLLIQNSDSGNSAQTASQPKTPQPKTQSPQDSALNSSIDAYCQNLGINQENDSPSDTMHPQKQNELLPRAIDEILSQRFFV